jgi:hypothetical protein
MTITQLGLRATCSLVAMQLPSVVLVEDITGDVVI